MVNNSIKCLNYCGVPPTPPRYWQPWSCLAADKQFTNSWSDSVNCQYMFNKGVQSGQKWWETEWDGNVWLNWESGKNPPPNQDIAVNGEQQCGATTQRGECWEMQTPSGESKAVPMMQWQPDVRLCTHGPLKPWCRPIHSVVWNNTYNDLCVKV